MWRVELRRSRAALPAAALLLVGLATLAVDRDSWVGDGQATSLRVQFTLLALAPLSAATCALLARRNRRPGLDVLVAGTPRGHASAAFLHYRAVAAWLVLPYVLLAVVGTAVTGTRSSGLHVWPSYLLLGLGTLVAVTSIGYCAGHLVPLILTPPLVGASVFGLILASGDLGERAQRLVPFYPAGVASPAQVLRPTFVAAQLGWTLAIALLSWGVVVATHASATRSRLGLLATATLLVLGFLVWLLAGPTPYVPRRAVAPTCAGRGPTVCAWPEHQKWLTDATDVSSGLGRALQGVYSFPAVVYETGLAPRPDQRTPALVISSAPVRRTDLVPYLSAGLVPPRPPECVIQHPELFDRYVLTQAWLRTASTGELGPGISVDPAALAHLLDQPTAQQLRWVAESAALVASCR